MNKNRLYELIFSFYKPDDLIHVNGRILSDHFKSAKNQSIRSNMVKGAIALMVVCNKEYCFPTGPHSSTESS